MEGAPGKSVEGPVEPAPTPNSKDRVEDVLGFRDVSVGLRYGDPSDFQGTHKGWDLWAEKAVSEFRPLYGGKILEVRDGNSSGYINCLQVQYTEGPLAGYAVQIGHVKAGISRNWKAGDKFKAGSYVCECGSASDGRGVRHFHVEFFSDPQAALAYDHSKAIDPSKIRKLVGERDVYRRPGSFGGGTSSASVELTPALLRDYDICTVSHD